MTQPIIPPFVLHTLQQVSPERLQRAVSGLFDGSLSITLTRQKDTEIRALVSNGEGKDYGVVLSEPLTSCSCKDALYRGVICKHAAAVTLRLLRLPQLPIVKPVPAPQLIHLTKEILPSGPRLCGSPDYSLPAWVIPFVPEQPWQDRTCLQCWALYTQPAAVSRHSA